MAGTEIPFEVLMESLQAQGMKRPEGLTPELDQFIDRLLVLLAAEKEENEQNQEMLRNTRGFMDSMLLQIKGHQMTIAHFRERVDELEGKLSYYRKYVTPKPPKSIEQLILDEENQPK